MPEILNRQYILFMKSDLTNNFDSISVKLKDKLGQSLSTQIIPIPPEAPPEIPRLVLTYPNYVINVSQVRAEVSGSKSTDTNDILLVLLKVLSTNFNVVFNRIALIKTIFVDGDLANLKSNINSSKLSSDNISEIKLRVNKPITLDGFDCNNIEDIEYATLILKSNDSQQPQIKKGILINRDINTIADRDYRFNDTNVPKLLTSLNKSADDFVIFEN